MDYKKYLDKHLVNQVKEQIEENDENTFALVLINEQHSDYNSVFDDLEMNHYFTTIPWVEEGEYSIRFLSGYNLDVSANNLKAILKDVYIDSCEVPLNIIT
jgi:hypothetical protein